MDLQIDHAAILTACIKERFAQHGPEKAPAIIAEQLRDVILRAASMSPAELKKLDDEFRADMAAAAAAESAVSTSPSPPTASSLPTARSASGAGPSLPEALPAAEATVKNSQAKDAEQSRAQAEEPQSAFRESKAGTAQRRQAPAADNGASAVAARQPKQQPPAASRQGGTERGRQPTPAGDGGRRIKAAPPREGSDAPSSSPASAASRAPAQPMRILRRGEALQPPRSSNTAVEAGGKGGEATGAAALSPAPRAVPQAPRSDPPPGVTLAPPPETAGGRLRPASTEVDVAVGGTPPRSAPSGTPMLASPQQEPPRPRESPQPRSDVHPDTPRPRAAPRSKQGSVPVPKERPGGPAGQDAARPVPSSRSAEGLVHPISGQPLRRTEGHLGGAGAAPAGASPATPRGTDGCQPPPQQLHPAPQQCPPRQQPPLSEQQQQQQPPHVPAQQQQPPPVPAQQQQPPPVLAQQQQPSAVRSTQPHLPGQHEILGQDTFFYEVLELEPDCTAEEIFTQYRQLSIDWHPDNYPRDQQGLAMEVFTAVANAYEVLGDPELRSVYDSSGQLGLRAEARRTRPHATQYEFRDPLDLFISVFDGRGGVGAARDYRPPPAIQTTLPNFVLTGHRWAEGELASLWMAAVDPRARGGRAREVQAQEHTVRFSRFPGDFYPMHPPPVEDVQQRRIEVMEAANRRLRGPPSPPPSPPPPPEDWGRRSRGTARGLELRRDADGVYYSRIDFLKYYGGYREWSAARGTRKLVPRRDRAPAPR
eukprot:TRINITY_DN31788_c0_g1_i1.p1 TRINITY_DN31788_c0_g1~~TRINITY_DN31788_c0_g1_i1.p1  ORF type:complete len:764 (+),score=128.24 TRINITY_DN31788_c0_g1_i1:98-2389(+)